MSKTNSTKATILISVIIGSLIIGSSIIYSQNTPSMVSIVDDELLEKDGQTYEVYTEDPVFLTVINDFTCEECKTGEIISGFKKQTGTPIAARYVEFNTTEAKELIEEFDASYIPFYIVGDEVESLPNYGHLAHHVISGNDVGSYIDMQKIGQEVGRYLDANYYAKDDPEAPKADIENTNFDFGDISTKDGIVQTEFTIMNSGKNPLEFLNFNSSCGCTTFIIEVDGEQSPVFKMAGHGEPVEWDGELSPGEEAKVIVTYDPAVHPDLTGAVKREVFITTNDPNLPELKFSIELNQTV